MLVIVGRGWLALLLCLRFGLRLGFGWGIIVRCRGRGLRLGLFEVGVVGVIGGVERG